LKPSAYIIYNASAGSGKTFTITKAYLKQLIASKNPQYFKHLLAITFTNKAVGEMKQRIIDMLKAFSEPQSLLSPNAMFITICDELKLSPKQLHEKSKLVLNHIIYNYGAFDISTIDGFTHRVIRTFALDLKLALNFEVELDQERILNEAVDQLIAKTGTDKALSKVLIDFAIEKADDDKSWDISYDFNKIAKLLLSETNLEQLQTIKEKSLDDFAELKKTLKAQLKTTETSITEEAKAILTLIDEAGLQHDDFSSGYLPKHFIKLSQANFNVSYDTKWQDNLETKILYPKRVSEAIASIIEQIQPELYKAFNSTKNLILKSKLYTAVYKNLTSLSVLTHIQKELEVLKDDKNILLISEFNKIIGEEIKNQPTPFIYERLGEKFKHYFIDEFQDTSKLQWANLIPLLDNTLATEQGTTMLVGDAKQAIYRWRGGEAEQFINLYNNSSNPFQVSPKVLDLDTNYRSAKSIIDFNNGFFKFLGATFFDDANYASLYQNATQKTHNTSEGYVSLQFLDIDKTDDKNELYAQKVLGQVHQCLQLGYQPKDICILVRKRKEGVAIANYLSEYQIKISSSETLLLKNSPKVLLLQTLLKILETPNNTTLHLEVLLYLADTNAIEDKHRFFVDYLTPKTTAFFQGLKHLGITIEESQLRILPLYEQVEYFIIAFHLNNTSDAYVQFYLDEVFMFSNKNGSDISAFITHFEQKEDSLSIVIPLDPSAVQIMTIHKSKGLEFPVVIFPFAELNIYKELDPKVWFPIDKNIFNGFDTALINYNTSLSNFGIIGEAIYESHQSELELDAINLLYVALTRAENALFVIAKKDLNSKGDPNLKTYSGLFIQYLKEINRWQDTKLYYSFGKLMPTPENTNQKEETITIPLISVPKEAHKINIVTTSGRLWDTKRAEAIERGNLIHLILSKIKTTQDLNTAFETLKYSGEITDDNESELLEATIKVIEHPKLNIYYSDIYTIYNECDIITPNGDILRPDRLNITTNNEVVIIDYKTGDPEIYHAEQLTYYETILLQMKYTVVKKLLIYINDDINIIEA